MHGELHPQLGACAQQVTQSVPDDLIFTRIQPGVYKILEAEVAQLKQAQHGTTAMSVPWWTRRFGAFQDDPMYDEAVRLGVAYRQSQPTPEDAHVSVGH